MTLKNRLALSKIVKIIKKNKYFFIAGHLKPDGDTVGSALALASLLRRLGKIPFIYTKDAIPDNLLFLPRISKIKKTDIVLRDFDCAIILECSNFERMGSLISPKQARTIINIDHHTSFTAFGDINYCDPIASSSSEQIFALFESFGLKITKDEAVCLYTGLVTDTGKFQHANTTPSALRMAATLIEAGVKPELLFDKIFAFKPIKALRLLGSALTTLSLDSDCRIAYMTITNDMYHKSGATPMDTEEIINYSIMVPGVLIGLMFRENYVPGAVKVSFRSRGNIDVSAIAQYFGGGGHKNAAGCSIDGSLRDAKTKVLEYLCKIMR